ncbi:unnamed protein product [Cyprideis torosa]|uniref:Uncharacterized protein n=1 Tax=Cyprideis torosa TaxID=163714 RepID=A0A7R8WD48_9CRUS|nr:unnamed protein product [Cyprideis torosa]CAG0888183.1 unnamed protein product [Cyprideis torosa]
MAATRKLQGEIDRCLKKVSEGVETFEDTWKKVQHAANTNQKEKYEADLKKEIKKLQRLRDQIKTWIASGEIKDKSALVENRKLIETQMERFKVVERETKTKAYSKEGLGAAQKMDPAQKEREEINSWLVTNIDELKIQCDQFESEIESLQAGGKKRRVDRDKQDRVESLKNMLERHRFHILKLELLLRMLDNHTVEVDVIKKIQDDVEYYIECCQDQEFNENEFMYDDICFEDVQLNTVVGVDAVTDLTDKDKDEDGTASTTSDTKETSPSSGKGGNGGKNSSGGTMVRSVSESSSQDLGKEFSSGGGHPPSLLSTPPSATAPSPLLMLNNHSNANATVLSAGAGSNGGTSGLPLIPLSPSSPIGGQSGTPTPPDPPLSNHLSHHDTTAGSRKGNAFLDEKGPSGPGRGDCDRSPSKPGEGPSLAGPEPVVPSPSTGSSVSAFLSSITGNVSSLISEVSGGSSVSTSSGSGGSSGGGGGLSTIPSILPASLLASMTSASASTGLNVNNPLTTPAPSTPPKSEPLPNHRPQLTSTTGLKTSSTSTLIPNGPSSLLSQPGELPTRATSTQPPSSLLEQQFKSGTGSDRAADLLAWTIGSESLSQFPPSAPGTAPSTATGLSPVAPLGLFPLTPEHLLQYQFLEHASYKLPQPGDSERTTPLPRTPWVWGHMIGSLPSRCDSDEFFSRLSTETLFFIFYYMESTKAQYQAAKALKKQSWRFHTKFLMWFQRHEEPKQITEEYEQGTYIYFDYEKWSQRKKEGFTFEYRYLEDRDLN